MIAQLQLNLRNRQARLRAGPRLAARMIAILAARRAWTTRAELSAHGLSDRQCRLARAASHGRIIRGQRGYLLLRFATAEDVRLCLGAWRAQIAAEQREYLLLCRRAHRVLHEPNAS